MVEPPTMMDELATWREKVCIHFNHVMGCGSSGEFDTCPFN